MITHSFMLLLLGLANGHAQVWSSKKAKPEPQEPAESALEFVDIRLFPTGMPFSVGPTPAGLANITAQGCNACHFQAHDDWKHSGHASAGQSTLFKDAIKRAGNSTACTQCHKPLRSQHAQLSAGFIDGDLSRPHLQDNPGFSATLMAEGIGCAACHVRDGQIVSTRIIDHAPHPVGFSSELGTSEMCATCHQLSYPEADRPFYDTYGEWEASPHAAAGIRCQDCHMPPKPGLATASRFAATPDHSWTADLGRALTVLVDMDKDQIQRGTPVTIGVKLQNTGAAHHVPTGSPYKSLQITVEVRDLNQKILTTSSPEVIQRTVNPVAPYNTISDNRIAAGGEHEFSTELTVSHRAKPGSAQMLILAKQGTDVQEILQVIPLELY